jgi:hypothetical protein
MAEFYSLQRDFKLAIRRFRGNERRYQCSRKEKAAANISAFPFVRVLLFQVHCQNISQMKVRLISSLHCRQTGCGLPEHFTYFKKLHLSFTAVSPA